jgi:hypothetical protein
MNKLEAPPHKKSIWRSLLRRNQHVEVPPQTESTCGDPFHIRKQYVEDPPQQESGPFHIRIQRVGGPSTQDIIMEASCTYGIIMWRSLHTWNQYVEAPTHKESMFEGPWKDEHMQRSRISDKRVEGTTMIMKSRRDNKE